MKINMNLDPTQTPKLTPEQTAALMLIFQRTLQIGAANMGMNRTCLSCAHFQEQTELCAKWNARPPARVIVESCPEWTGGTPF